MYYQQTKNINVNNINYFGNTYVHTDIIIVHSDGIGSFMCFINNESYTR